MRVKKQALELMRLRVIREKREEGVLNFCSNDYLGLSIHPEIKKAFIQGINQYGVGSGASPMVSGYYKPQAVLEEKFAEFLGREKAILFNSGYHANVGIIPVLSTRENIIISDKLCHASLLDGIQLSRAKHKRYRHTDMPHLESHLKSTAKTSLVVTENVFSMSGDIAPLKKIIELAKQYNSLLLVDDAHGMGVLEPSYDGIDCLVTPLGKAVGGMGAIVSGKAEVMEEILQFSRTYMYSTALPPALSVAMLKALEIMQKEQWRREKLNSLIYYFIKQAKSRNLRLISNDLTPIKSFLVGDNQKAINIQKKLLQEGFWVSCIRPPTVPKHTARIRISLNCHHEESQIKQLLDAYEF